MKTAVAAITGIIFMMKLAAADHKVCSNLTDGRPIKDVVNCFSDQNARKKTINYVDSGVGFIDGVGKLANAFLGTDFSGEIIDGVFSMIDAAQRAISTHIDLSSQHCVRLSALKQLCILQNGQSGLDEVKKQLSELVAPVKDLQNKLSKLTAYTRETRRRLIDMDHSLEKSLRAISGGQVTLSHKLNSVLRKVTENGEALRYSSYLSLMTAFILAIAEIRGAFADFLVASSNLEALEVSLANVTTVTALTSAVEKALIEERLQLWLEAFDAMSASTYATVQNAWSRAQTGLMKAVGVLVDGGLARLHYEQRLKESLRAHLAKSGISEANAFFNSSLDSSLERSMDSVAKEVFDDDALINVVRTAVLRCALIGITAHPIERCETRDAAEKEFFATLTPLADVFEDIHMQYAMAYRPRLAEALNPLLPAYMPADADCSASAFKAGFVGNEQLVKWEEDFAILNPSQIITYGTKDETMPFWFLRSRIMFICTGTQFEMFSPTNRGKRPTMLPEQFHFHALAPNKGNWVANVVALRSTSKSTPTQAFQVTHFFCGGVHQVDLVASSADQCERDAAILSMKLGISFHCNDYGYGHAGQRGPFLRNINECNSISPEPMQAAYLKSLGLRCNGHINDPWSGPGRFVALDDCEAKVDAFNSYVAGSR